jgi:hypothetical protein
MVAGWRPAPRDRHVDTMDMMDTMDRMDTMDSIDGMDKTTAGGPLLGIPPLRLT